MKSPQARIVRTFVEAINCGDIATISSLLSKDHKFIDSLGGVLEGRENTVNGWRAFFQMFPDYRIDIARMIREGNTVMAHGTAAGTYAGSKGVVPENHVSMPAAWVAVIRGSKLEEWRVFADWQDGCKLIETDRRR